MINPDNKVKILELEVESFWLYASFEFLIVRKFYGWPSGLHFTTHKKGMCCGLFSLRKHGSYFGGMP